MTETSHVTTDEEEEYEEDVGSAVNSDGEVAPRPRECEVDETPEAPQQRL
jgi:hypothetical protein